MSCGMSALCSYTCIDLHAPFTHFQKVSRGSALQPRKSTKEGKAGEVLWQWSSLLVWSCLRASDQQTVAFVVASLGGECSRPRLSLKVTRAVVQRGGEDNRVSDMARGSISGYRGDGKFSTFGLVKPRGCARTALTASRQISALA
jgi:hypothetical protein